MSHRIRITGLDLTLSNMGWCRCFWSEQDGLCIEDAGLTQTKKVDKAQRKLVSVQEDLFARAMTMKTALDSVIADADIVMSEVPTGAAQSPSAIWSFGITVGLLTSVPRLIRVLPDAAKNAALGRKTGTKKEMIEWAVKQYPDTPWIKDRGRPNGRITNDNEHIADAIGVVHAGLLTQRFQHLLQKVQDSPPF